MSRIPKWLLLKEWLACDEILKLANCAPTSLENVLAEDHSEDFSLQFRFVCSFNPEICQKEYKEYRFENIARQSMRAHLKEHINNLETNSSEEEKRTFSTRNQLFKGRRGFPQKPKNPAKSEAVAKKRKISKISEKETDSENQTKEPKKRKKKTYTKLKDLPESPAPKDLQLKEKVTVNIVGFVKNEDLGEDEIIEEDKSSAEDEVALDIKSEKSSADEAEPGGKINCHTQTDHGGKEQQTLQYKVATKLFATDKSRWRCIEQTLADIVSAEKTTEKLSQADIDRILDGMNQWIESAQIYDRLVDARQPDPLSPSEKTLLKSISRDDWKKLDKATDPESKLRLTVYGRLLLRDYEIMAKKCKPKVCRHCGRHYTASTSLHSHLLSLSGIRFWICSKCKCAKKEEATFTRKHSLQYHILKEVGIPRYRCTQPGCSKTHNHTHHQKSHARQHTGEKHYVCSVQGCKGRFSNRNTYSRHLLQFHHVELTRTNQLREIDEKEAKLKVYAARLKARERSKTKRQQGTDNPGPVHQPRAAPKKMKIDENILTAAQHFLSEVKREEEIAKDSTNSLPELNLEKLMRPSASQLLYGIARDVRNTTSSIEEAKTSESMLGGLNLLATVSKYMNTESCNKLHETEDDKCSEMYDCEDCDENKNQIPKTCNPGCQKVTCDSDKIMTEDKLEIKDPEYISSEQHEVKTADGLHGDQQKIVKKQVSPSLVQNGAEKSTPARNEGKQVGSIEMVNAVLPNKYVSVNNVKLLSMPVSSPPSTSNATNLLRVIQTPVSQLNSGYKKQNISSFKGSSTLPSQVFGEALKMPHKYLIPLPRNKGNSSPRNTVPVTSCTPSNLLQGALMPKVISTTTSRQGDAVVNTHVNVKKAATVSTFGTISTPTNQGHNLKAVSCLPPLSSMISSRGVVSKVETLLPGRIVADTHTQTLLNKSPIPLSTVSGLNQTHNKNIQVIKVTNTSCPLQLRSVSSLSGKTYIVLTSSDNQNKLNKSSVVGDKSSEASRTLPFAEL